jgi:hypothetical protein
MNLVGERPAARKGRTIPPPADTNADKANTIESARKMLA